MTHSRTVTGYPVERQAEVLTEAALDLVATLHRRFRETRSDLLHRRRVRRDEVARTGRLDFLPETREVREGTWTVAPAPRDLRDRRVEITGPTDRKMAINALNSGAQVWLADFEDSNTPTWANVVGGQVNLIDAVARTISYDSPEGREYRVEGPTPATIVVRPRGWHLDERHVLVDGEPAIAAFFDVALYVAGNARRLLSSDSGPYFYLPKMESHLEARLWNDVFDHTERALSLAHGAIRATILIETIPAAFEMDEILFELRDRACGLNAGRWDYLFSLIKLFRDSGRDFVLPDRNAITMTAPMMRSYTDLLVATCHRRGAHAIGGMAAFIPSRRDTEVNEAALSKVRADKEREASDGFDGSWVAHPDLVPVCRSAFDGVLHERENQLDRSRDDVSVSAGELLAVSATPGAITEAGLRNDIAVALRYLESWLRGNGAAGIFNLMEDVATAEIARSQVWQWVHNGVTLTGGAVVTADLVRALVRDELAAIRAEQGDAADNASRWVDAQTVFERVALGDEFVDFLTFETYPLID